MNSSKDSDVEIRPELEEALFQKLLGRLTEALQAASDGASTAGAAVAASAASAADFVQRHSAVIAPLAVGAAVSALTAATIVRRSRPQADDPGEERVGFMFRSPASLRDALSALAARQNRSMNELMTEAVLDLLAKYGVPYTPVSDEAAPEPR